MRPTCSFLLGRWLDMIVVTASGGVAFIIFWGLFASAADLLAFLGATAFAFFGSLALVRLSRGHVRSAFVLALLPIACFGSALAADAQFEPVLGFAPEAGRWACIFISAFALATCILATIKGKLESKNKAGEGESGASYWRSLGVALFYIVPVASIGFTFAYMESWALVRPYSLARICLLPLGTAIGFIVAILAGVLAEYEGDPVAAVSRRVQDAFRRLERRPLASRIRHPFRGRHA